MPRLTMRFFRLLTLTAGIAGFLSPCLSTTVAHAGHSDGPNVVMSDGSPVGSADGNANHKTDRH